MAARAVYRGQLLQPVVQLSALESLRSASTGDLVVPSTRLRTTEAFSVAGPRCWNLLPAELKQTTDTMPFRRGLKTCLNNQAYGNYETP